MSGSGISWATCKSAPRSRQITMPAPHHSVFYRPDDLSAAQPTASVHWRHSVISVNFPTSPLLISLLHAACMTQSMKLAPCRRRVAQHRRRERVSRAADRAWVRVRCHVTAESPPTAAAAAVPRPLPSHVDSYHSSLWQTDRQTDRHTVNMTLTTQTQSSW